MLAKRIAFTGVGKAELETFELPEIRPDEILIETDYTAVSAGTERANLMAMPNTPRSFPAYLGYSGSGHVLQVGSEVENVRPGDRVLIDHSHHQSHVVASFRKNGDGYFPYHQKVDALDAAFVVVGSMGVQGLRKTRLEFGETCMITGLGLLGQFALQTAVHAGGLPVIGVDFEESRRNTALALGADAVLSPADPEFMDRVKELTGGRMINANVEVTGSFKALQQALSVAAWEGRITLTGCTRISDGQIDYYSQVHRKGIQLIGAHNFVRPTGESYPGYWTRHDDFRVILDCIESGRFKVKPILSEVVSPSECGRIYSRLAENPVPPLGIAFEWNR